MDTRQLKTLVSIWKHGTFAKAANDVCLTPAAVGQQIAALEQELDIILFDRTSRPPKLTPQGMQTVEMASQILRLEEDTKLSLKGDLVSGTFVIGAVRSSALNLLPSAMVEMNKGYPNLKTSLKVGLSKDLVSDVASGQLDAAIVAEHIKIPPNLKWSPFINEPLWLISSHEISGMTLREILSQFPFIRFNSNVPLANLINTELSRMEISTLDVAEVDNIESIITCVHHGLGVSVVPQMSIRPEMSNIYRVPFGAPQIKRQIGIVERQSSPRKAVIETLHDVLTAKIRSTHERLNVIHNTKWEALSVTDT